MDDVMRAFPEVGKLVDEGGINGDEIMIGKVMEKIVNKHQGQNPTVAYTWWRDSFYGDKDEELDYAIHDYSKYGHMDLPSIMLISQNIVSSVFK